MTDNSRWELPDAIKAHLRLLSQPLPPCAVRGCQRAAQWRSRLCARCQVEQSRALANEAARVRRLWG